MALDKLRTALLALCNTEGVKYMIGALQNLLGGLGLGSPQPAVAREPKPEVPVEVNRAHPAVAQTLAQANNTVEAKTNENEPKSQQKTLLAKLESLITNQTASLDLLAELKTLITNFFSNKKEEAAPAAQAPITAQENELANLEQMLQGLTGQFAAAGQGEDEAKVSLKADNPLAQLTELLNASTTPTQQAA